LRLEIYFISTFSVSEGAGIMSHIGNRKFVEAFALIGSAALIFLVAPLLLALRLGTDFVFVLVTMILALVGGLLSGVLLYGGINTGVRAAVIVLALLAGFGILGIRWVSSARLELSTGSILLWVILLYELAVGMWLGLKSLPKLLGIGWYRYTYNYTARKLETISGPYYSIPSALDIGGPSEGRYVAIFHWRKPESTLSP
jgi:hypothetical protein